MGNINVVWIDDHINNYSEYIKALKQEGITILPASNVSDGLTQMNKKQISLVLLDLRMPGESGFEFLNRVKKRTNIPICILSSYLHLQEYQAKISRLRSNVGILDKKMPSPKTEAFKIFSDTIKYYAQNPPQYTPSRRSHDLTSSFLNMDPFEISFRKYLNLPSKVKRGIRKEAEKQAKQAINHEFENGKAWVLFCGDTTVPTKSLEISEEIPSNQDIIAIAMELDRVPFQFSAPDQVDDIISGTCTGPSDIQNYPTVTLGIGGRQICAHFDTGSPFTFFSFEELNELEVLGINLVETDGRRGPHTYEYYRDEIKVEIFDQKTGQKKIGNLNLRAIKNWADSPYKIVCPTSCGTKGKLCKNRAALIGRNIIFQNAIELTLCGVTGKTSINKRRRTTRKVTK